MEKKLRFYKEEGRWYADVPEHTKEDNEMVFGSDEFLDVISNNKTEVTLAVTTDEPKKGYYIKLALIMHDDDGGEYIISRPLADELNEMGFTVWICNVTHTVFGEHPEVMYLTEIKDETNLLKKLFKNKRSR